MGCSTLRSSNFFLGSGSSMKKILIFTLALVLVLSSCSPASTVSSGADSESSKIESAPEPEDIYANKIAENRKKVYEMLENCDDILDTIPNPAKTDTIPTGEISVYTGEKLPDCVTDWAYNYFSYMVTGKVYEKFDRTSQEAQILRFLAAMVRVNDEIADDIGITAFLYRTKTYPQKLEDTFVMTFCCVPYKYDESTGEYKEIQNAGERIDVAFFLSREKENEEWAIENIRFLGGNYYDYANACKNKTWGRFPEVDRYDIVDYAICEYTEKLFNFDVRQGM